MFTILKVRESLELRRRPRLVARPPAGTLSTAATMPNALRANSIAEDGNTALSPAASMKSWQLPNRTTVASPRPQPSPRRLGKGSAALWFSRRS